MRGIAAAGPGGDMPTSVEAPGRPRNRGIIGVRVASTWSISRTSQGGLYTEKDPRRSRLAELAGARSFL